MNNEVIAKRVEHYVEENLKNVPFDNNALLSLRKILWKIADEEGTTGAEIFTIYMDYKSSKTNH